MSGPPVFVVGAPRSGTTLVRFVLNSSGRIFIPPESEFIPRFYGRRPLGPIDRAVARRHLDAIFDEYRFASQWQGPRPSVAELLGGRAETTPAELLDWLYTRYAEQYGTGRWGDKTPIYTNHIDTLVRIFPAARVVHVVRDGRDVVASTIAKWSDSKRHIDPYYAARKWSARVDRARAAGRRLPARQYLEIRYEHLVSDPEPVVRALCEFADLPFTGAELHPEELASQQLAPGFHEQVRHPITTSRIGRWRDDLSGRELRIVENVGRRQLIASGYEPSASATMSLADRATSLALAAKYHTFTGGRRMLEAAGIFPPN